MRGRPFVEPALRIPVEQTVQRAAQVDTGKVLAAAIKRVDGAALMGGGI